ncbi:MAG: hypothetical protein RLZZ618_1533 [Pseudomonadota bacterium]|jgi:hypothetical protein
MWSFSIAMHACLRVWKVLFTLALAHTGSDGNQIESIEKAGKKPHPGPIRKFAPMAQCPLVTKQATMNRSPSPTPAATPLVSKEAFIALMTGLVMGQLVSAIAIHHDGSMLGLVLALVFVLSGSASLMLLMCSWPSRDGVARQGAVYGWLAALGGGLLMSLQAYTLLG